MKIHIKITLCASIIISNNAFGDIGPTLEKSYNWTSILPKTLTLDSTIEWEGKKFIVSNLNTETKKFHIILEHKSFFFKEIIILQVRDGINNEKTVFVRNNKKSFTQEFRSIGALSGCILASGLAWLIRYKRQ